MSDIKNVINNDVNNSIFPFLWVHHESKDKLKRTISWIYNSGAKGFCIESRPHPDFLGKTWWEDLDFILDQAKKLGLKVWILDDSHFPTGFVDGRVPQKFQKQFLYIKQLDFAGPLNNVKILLKYLNPTGFNVKKRQTDKVLKVLVAKKTNDDEIDSQKILDVTNQLDKNFLKISLPEGQWRVFVLVQTYDGGEKETKNYLNPIVKGSTEVLVNLVYEKHYQHYKNLFGKTILGFFSDEPRFGNIHGSFNQIGKTDMVLPWRDNMLTEFFAEDYKLLPLLSQTKDIHHEEVKIRYKYMDVVSDLYAKNFSDVLQKWCKEHDIEHIGHLLEDNGAHARLGYGPGHYFRAMHGYDMAGIDVVLNQIMPGLDNGFYKAMTKSGWNGEFFHYGLADLANSDAQLDPSKKRRAMVELFGAYGWAEGLPLMKYIADHMMVRGINYFVPHAFNSYNFPDPDCPPHFYANGNEPEKEYYPVLFKYMNRVSSILRGSMELCKVAVLYHAENEWLDPKAMPFEKVTKRLYQKQISHELVTIDFLKVCAIRKKEFQIYDHKFSCLIIPQTKAITSDLTKIINKLIKNKVQVIFINKIPKYDENYQSIAKQISGAEVKALENFEDDLERVSDIKLSITNNDLRLYRFKNKQYNGAFAFNENINKKMLTNINLDQKHDVYLFDPMNMNFYLIGNQIDNFDLVLGAGHACFILFDLKLNVNIYQKPKQIKSEKIAEWDLDIENKHFTNFNLRDINELTGLENYAGRSIYKTTLELESLSSKLVLSLGKIGEVAKLKINGRLVGRAIEQNPEFDITSFVKIGKNKVEIEIVNNLAIKIQDPETQFSAILPAGLLGPVYLKTFE